MPRHNALLAPDRDGSELSFSKPTTDKNKSERSLVTHACPLSIAESCRPVRRYHSLITIHLSRFPTSAFRLRFLIGYWMLDILGSRSLRHFP